MHKIKEMLMKELYEYEDKAKRSSGKLSAGDLETIHKLTDTVKNIDKIEMFEEGGEYSGDTDFVGEGRMYGTSYRGGNSYNSNDGQGGSSYGQGGSSYGQGGSSYARGRGRNARRDSRGRYSRDGYSQGGAKESLIEKLEEAMDEAENEQDREKIRRVIMQIENA